MLLTCGIGFLLLSLSTVVAMIAGFSAGESRGAEAIFVLALVSAASAVLLILVDLLVAYLRAVERTGEGDDSEPAGSLRDTAAL
jgi:hypothetical protein